jgi:hypothetical protein
MPGEHTSAGLAFKLSLRLRVALILVPMGAERPGILARPPPDLRIRVA